MASEKMYDLAFQYRATKLWKKMFDDELFAVRLSDGETGYCCVMGMLGDHIALGLYVGAEGYGSYREIFDAAGVSSDYIAAGELMTCQNCLQCSFENKDMLSDGEAEEVRRYAKARQKLLRGRNAFPQFTKYQPGKYPWHYDSETDEQRICEALSAALALSKLLEEHTKQELHLCSLREGSDRIPLLSCDNGQWTMEDTALPEVTKQYPAPVMENEILMARLRRIRKRGNWECGTMRLPTPVQEDTDTVPYFPLLLIAADQEGSIFSPVISDGDDAAEIANEFAQKLLEAVCPASIYAGDDRCFAILQDLCKKAGIQLIRQDHLQVLDEAMQALYFNFDRDEGEDEGGMSDPEELAVLCESLMAMSDGELRQMPAGLINMLLDLAEWGVVSEEFAGRLRKLFR